MAGKVKLKQLDQSGAADGELARWNNTLGVWETTGVVVNASDQVENMETATFNAEHDFGNSGSTPALDWNDGQKQKITLNAATPTFTFTDPPGPCNLILKMVQDATGGRDPVWPSTVKWPTNGTEPTWSAGAADIDIIAFYFDGTDYYSVATLDFA